MNRPASVTSGPRARPGLTRIELLAILGVCLAVVGVASPILLSYRETSRRTACLANQGKLAQALIAFDGQKQFIPGIRNPHPCGEVTAEAFGSVSWPVLILPQIDRDDAYSLWTSADPSGKIATPAPPIATFVCPAAPSSSVPQHPSLSYAGNAGIGVVRINNINKQFKHDGVMMDTLGIRGEGSYTPMRVSVEFVSSGDGTQSTLLLSEKASFRSAPTASYDVSPGSLLSPDAYRPSLESWKGQAPVPAPGFGVFPADPTNREFPYITSNTMLNSDIAGNDGFYARPSSDHAGVAIAAFVDGHCVAISDKIDAQTYCQLITSNSKSGFGQLERNVWLKFLPEKPPAGSSYR